MNSNEIQLDRQLRSFRRKYYTDKIIRGSLILGMLVLSMLFVALLSEGFFGFSTGVRTFMVLLLGAVFVGTFGYMIAWPALKLFNMSRGISDYQIANIVRHHFPNVNDKLINLLQLRRSLARDNALAVAAINQKTDEVAPVPFSGAIDFRVNRRYLYLLLIPLALLVVFWVADRDMFLGSGERLAKFNQEFVPPPPFSLNISGVPEQLIAGEDVELTVEVDGDALPEELFVFIKRESEESFIDYNLARKEKSVFTYKLSDVKQPFSFYVGNPEVRSDIFDVAVFKRPFIRNFRVTVRPPAYTGLPAETLGDNIGDFKALRGSSVSWELDPQGEVSEAKFVGAESQTFDRDESDGSFRYSQRLMRDLSYFILLNSPDNVQNIDTVRYRAQVLADRYPSLYIFSPNNDFLVDLDTEMPLELEIADDYGFSKMGLFYRFVKSGGESEVSPEYREMPLALERRALLQPRSYRIDLTSLGLREGDELEYYIKVWDNDAVTGPKATTSATFKVMYPTLDAKYEEVGAEQDNIQEQLEALNRESEELKEQYRKLQEDLLNKRQLSFDDRRQIQQLLQDHQQLQESTQEMQQQFEEMKNKLENNQMVSQTTLEKYERLNEMLENMNNPEVEEMLRELQERLEEVTPEEMMQEMDKLQMDEERIQDALERTMELLRQLEVQQKIDELRNKLDQLDAKEANLNEKTEQTDPTDQQGAEEMEQLSERQEELESQMEQIQEDIEALQDMKSETQTPDEEKMDEVEKLAEEAREEMEEAAEKMDQSGEQGEQGQQQQSQQSKQEASESQQNARQKMQEMSQMLSGMQMQMQQQQDQQNLESLRELLENLLTLSFDQEDLRDEVRELKYGDPSLKEKSQSQKKLQDDMGLVRDSLEALASRMFTLEQFVMEESRTITENMQKSQVYFRNKQIPMITYHQQTAMTSVNNLANELSRQMDNLQQQMKSAMAGQGMCPKPSPGQGMSMQQMIQQQQQLNQQMQQMMGGSGTGGQVDPQKLSQMAAQQEAIRKALQEAHQRIQEEGGSQLGDMGQVAEDMEETERELLNQQLTRETLLRQQQILTRLLYSDRAMRERGQDNRRESKTGRVEDRKSPEELTQEEFRNRLRQELLRTNQLEYSTDFIKLIEQYYQKLDERP